MEARSAVMADRDPIWRFTRGERIAYFSMEIGPPGHPDLPTAAPPCATLRRARHTKRARGRDSRRCFRSWKLTRARELLDERNLPAIVSWTAM